MSVTTKAGRGEYSGCATREAEGCCEVCGRDGPVIIRIIYYSPPGQNVRTSVCHSCDDGEED